ncbi:ATP-binding protein [Streptomyces chartreusis]|uniref:ATP-binding protein n=1 Tax=Streptomyces chartreusis TaxID=1969 RepID=UPI0036C405C3
MAPEDDHEDADGFKPLSDQLRPEIGELARVLRRLLKLSGKSQRQFAVTYRISVSSVSRYLSGERIPDKHFLDGLMKSACKANGTEVSADLQAEIYQRHRDALLADNPERFREQMASDRLEEAVLREEELQLESRELHRAVQGYQQQLRALESQLREIKAAQRQDQGSRRADIERRRTRREELEEECARLRDEVARLEQALKDAERERDTARLRCQELEAELVAANEAAERADLERRAREERLRLAKAVDTTEDRIADLARVHQEAERVRTEAGWEAAKQLEQARTRADELLKDAAIRATTVRPSVLKRSAALRQLKEAAMLMADLRIPELAEQLALDSPQELQAAPFLPPIGLQSHDDIGQAARAIEAVQRACVELAVDQALLRQKTTRALSHLARRNQALIHRLLTRIDELEAVETDPQRLSRLFELDHLATQMSRACESLFAFTGTPSGRRPARPVALRDVLRAAASEVEDYERIELTAVPACSVAAAVANDLVHLLAELLENALVFSPPGTQVEATAHALPDRRVLIEIHDSGIGMSNEDLSMVNQRLATPPAAANIDGLRLGLDVACRLGARHAIRMQLRPSDRGGTTALVMLPAGTSDAPGGTRTRHPNLAVTMASLFGAELPLQEEPLRDPQDHPAPTLHLFTICDSGGLFIEAKA